MSRAPPPPARSTGSNRPTACSPPRCGIIGRAAYAIVNRLVHPQVYRCVGIDPAVGRAASLTNPHFRETLRWSASKASAYLGDLGLIAGPGRLPWRRAGLL